MHSASYGELLLAFQPRTVHTEYDYAQVQAEIDRLLDKEQLSASEELYLDLLGTLLSAYEAQTERQSIYELRGIALIKGLLELQGLQQKDLIPSSRQNQLCRRCWRASVVSPLHRLMG